MFWVWFINFAIAIHLKKSLETEVLLKRALWERGMFIFDVMDEKQIFSSQQHDQMLPPVTMRGLL